jgi:hypothetical protein
MKFLHSFRLFFAMCWTLILIPAANAATEPAATPQNETKAITKQGYRIDQPGTITFTVGIKISGKVEKPQVMIFLPKEKTYYRNEVLKRSFSHELAQPLPFTPIIE